jgi:hypothetical protein
MHAMQISMRDWRNTTRCASADSLLYYIHRTATRFNIFKYFTIGIILSEFKLVVEQEIGSGKVDGGKVPTGFRAFFGLDLPTSIPEPRLFLYFLMVVL